jgi:hypothetical protein
MKTTEPLVHRIDVKDRNGRIVGQKEIVSYRGLLDMVHRERLCSLKTELLQSPSPQNGETAIVRATVRTSRGTFTGIGDANPRNVNARIVPHLIRMAETRAEARAMRKAVNIGVVAIEELAGDSGDLVADAPIAVGADAPPENDTREPKTVKNELSRATTRSDSSRASDQQRRYLYRLLQERNIEGDDARAFIKKELGVATVKDAPKAAVSALIDRLKNGSGEHRAAHTAAGG